MREIKFRAWDIEKAKMIRPNNLVFHEFNDVEEHFKDDEKIFMQFTGLRDKNGKEIYESDLVRADTTIYEVIFETGGWSYRASASARPWWLFGDAESLEVIGNIYENPELLEAK